MVGLGRAFSMLRRTHSRTASAIFYASRRFRSPTAPALNLGMSSVEWAEWGRHHRALRYQRRCLRGDPETRHSDRSPPCRGRTRTQGLVFSGWRSLDLLKAHYAEFAKVAGVDPQYLRKILRFLSYGYDKFIHGHNITAMELYDGATNRFMLDGHKYPEKCREFKFGLVAKLREFLGVLVGVAQAFNMDVLAIDIAINDRRLTIAGELLVPD